MSLGERARIVVHQIAWLSDNYSSPIGDSIHEGPETVMEMGTLGSPTSETPEDRDLVDSTLHGPPVLSQSSILTSNQHCTYSP